MSFEKKFDTVAEIDNVARNSLLKPNSKLDNAVSHAAKSGLPPIAISPLQGQYLTIQCQLINAKNVLEVGTLGGYSTIWFASTGAKVTSLEINPKHRDVAAESCKGLDVDIILGSALDTMPKLADEGRKFDFVFIDADWEQQFEYFEWAVKLTRPNGLIYVDNVVREIFESGMKDSLPTKVGKLDKVQATLITTVSSHKGRQEDNLDGFLMAVVKE